VERGILETLSIDRDIDSFGWIAGGRLPGDNPGLPVRHHD
jgi:hypothetical protein